MKNPQQIPERSFQVSWPWLALSFLLLGLATAYSTFTVSQDTYRYLFVLDITQSMNVNDMEIEAGAVPRADVAAERGTGARDADEISRRHHLVWRAESSSGCSWLTLWADQYLSEFEQSLVYHLNSSAYIITLVGTWGN